MNYRPVTWQTVTLTAASALVASALLAFSRPVDVRIDGHTMESDVAPVTTASDNVFVPLRAFASALGARVTVSEVRGDNDAVVVTRGERTFAIRVGDRHATLNGMPLTLSHEPFRVRGRIMIGLKAVATAFDVRVHYDARSARIDVRTPGVVSIDTTTE